MSTAARKARKRARRSGIVAQSFDDGPMIPTRFQHPVKEGTPAILRRENQPRPIFGNGMGVAPTRNGITSKVAKRLRSYIAPETANFRKGNEPKLTAPEPVNEDPKPYRVGRKRFSIYDVLNRFHEEVSGELVWSPRKGYAQDQAEYGHDGNIPPVEYVR